MTQMTDKVAWIVTQNCNLDCPYCYVGDTTDRISFETRERIVDELLEYDFESIAFTGGDPLIYWDQIRQLLPRLSDLEISFDTNGSFVDEDVAAELAQYDDVEVRMSLNGSKPEIHDASRGDGAYQDVVAATEVLAEYDIDYALGTTLLPSNKDDVEGICERAAELGADSVGFHGYLPVFDVSDVPELTLEPGEYHEAIMDIKECHDRWDGDLSVYAGGTLPFTFLLSEDLRECYTEFGDELSLCSMGHKVNVTPTGDVVPCLYIRDAFGNLLEDDLGTIMDSEKARQYREIAASGDRGDPCGSCGFSDACGGCPAAELAADGSLTAGDSRCWVGSD